MAKTGGNPQPIAALVSITDWDRIPTMKCMVVLIRTTIHTAGSPTLQAVDREGAIMFLPLNPALHTSALQSATKANPTG
ncbi:hypothetical protein Hanom_Chr03g00255871 [Helianthus anomalus]